MCVCVCPPCVCFITSKALPRRSSSYKNDKSLHANRTPQVLACVHEDALLAVTQRDLGDEPGFSAARDAALAHHAKLPTEEQAWCQQELAELQAAASPPA